MDDRFIALVARMRKTQKDYFRLPYGDRKDAALAESKRLEREVDAQITMLRAAQQGELPL